MCQDIQPSQVEALIREYPGSYIKFSDYRTQPHLFGKTYKSFLAEYVALQKMYELCPAHIVRPILMAPGEQYYLTEYHHLIRRISDYSMVQCANMFRWQPEVFNDIVQTIAVFHDAGIVHGDLLGNLFLSLNKNGFIANWVLLDPVGIDSRDEHFSEACMKDRNDLERLLQDKPMSVLPVSASIATPRVLATVPTTERGRLPGYDTTRQDAALKELLRDAKSFEEAYGKEHSKLKTIIMTQLFQGTGIGEIESIVGQEPLYRFSNYEKCEEVLWALRRLSMTGDLFGLLGTLSELPLSRWKKFALRVSSRSKGE